MIPLRDHNPTRSKPIVTRALFLITIAVFVVLQPRNGSPALVELRPPDRSRANERVSEPPVLEDEFLYWQAAVPCEILANVPLDQVEIEAVLNGRINECVRAPRDVGVVFPSKHPAVSILVSMFLHGGWLHLLGNMLFLWIFANNVEDRFGRVRFLLFYVASGIVATLTHVASDPDSLVPVVGASGAIAGVMGAYLVLFPRARVTSVLAFLPVFPIRVPAWFLLGLWFLSQFWVNPNDGVAWVAHVGGFVFGVFVTAIVRSRLRNHADVAAYARS